MPAGNYNIQVDQGSTFVFYIEYQTEGGTGEDLRGYTAEMQVRRSAIDTGLVLQIAGGVSGNNLGVTHGGSTGEFVSGATYSGTLGSGGITLMGSTVGADGSSGGIYISADSISMSKVPAGKHFYDIELHNGSGTVERILGGRFDVSREITR
jgi:hypothetical protein